MTRRFRVSLGWGITAAVLAGALALLVCWSLDPWPRIGVVVVVATLFGALAYFGGGKVVELMFDMLSYLLP